MAAIQEKIVSGQYDEQDVYNGDESGILYGAQPLKQYIPFSADRATAPEADDCCAIRHSSLHFVRKSDYLRFTRDNPRVCVTLAVLVGVSLDFS